MRFAAACLAIVVAVACILASLGDSNAADDSRVKTPTNVSSSLQH